MKTSPGLNRNRVIRLLLPVSAKFGDRVDWDHPLLRDFVRKMPQQEALLAAWRADQGYRWFFDRQDLDRLLRKLDPGTIEHGLRLGETFLSGAPELPTTATRMRKLRLDPASRISKDLNAVIIDWHEHDEKDNAEWMYMVNRHQYLPVMAMAARRTGRTDIAERIFELLDHWIANCPCLRDQIIQKRSRWGRHWKSVWQMLNSGLRLQAWLHVLHILWDSPGLTPVRFARYLHCLRLHALVVGRAAPCMDPGADGNHLIMETQGLLYWSVLPWMKENLEMRDVALHNMTRCLYRQVLPDGGQVERIPGYHMGCTIWFGLSTLLSRLNDWPLDPEAERRVAAMVKYAVSMTMPDHRLANFGDSSESDDRATFAFLSRLTGITMPWKVTLAGMQMLYANIPKVQRRHASWVPARFHPHVGYVCARSAWNERANAVVMHATGFGGGHTHSDWQSFIYAFRGRTLITERGVNTYDLDLENMRFRQGRAHNVLQIGERDPIVHQLNMWDKYVNAWARMIDFKAKRDGSAEWTGEIRYLDGTTWRRHARFSAPSGRLVFEDTLRGSRADFTELRYHLRTTHARMVSATECVTTDRNLPNIRIHVEGPQNMTTELAPVGLSPSFWERTQGLLLCFRCRPELPATWTTTIEGL